MIAFQSTLPAWGETRSRLLSAFPAAISIHSPRMGRDRTLPAARTGRTDFNPLSPHGERLPRAENPSPSPQFQSTLPAWGETYPQGAERKEHRKFQSTLPAWGETRGAHDPAETAVISIHSPRMGRDTTAFTRSTARRKFQSTLPAWGETGFGISASSLIFNFNPLSPHGERRYNI